MSKINTYQFEPTASEAQRDSVTLTLRKCGFKAHRETDTLHTDASRTGIGLCYGTANVVTLANLDRGDE